jgi:outer membrane protein
MRSSCILCLAAWLTAGSLSAAPPPPGTPTPAPPAVPTYPLSLDQAVKLALENSPDILVEKFGPELGREGEREALGAYDPLLDGTLLRTSNKSQGTNRLAGGQTVDSTSFEYDAGVSKLFATGGSLRLGFANRRSTTTSTFTSFNPLYDSSLTLNLRQPLLRDFFNDGARLQLRVAKNNRSMSDAQFAQILANTVASVKNLYYELLYRIDNLQANRKSFDLSQQLLGENRIRVRVGTLAPLDVVEAQSEVAGREQGVILAEAALADAQDALKRVVFPRTQADMWGLDIAPTDRPTAEPVVVDVDAALAVALKNRSDVVVARTRLDTAQLSAQYARNQALPQLDFVASYGSSGTAGTQLVDLQTGDVLPTPVVSGYGDALSAAFGRDFPTWSVGVNFSYPIMNRAAGARAASARISRDQTEATLRRVELDAIIDVRRAARAVESNYKSVEATRAARTLQEQRLDAEGKRFTAGLSTTFQVNQAQRDLASAQVAEIRAIADYRESLVAFDRSQQAPIGGVTIVGGQMPAVGAGSGTSTTTTTTTRSGSGSSTSTTTTTGGNTTSGSGSNSGGTTTTPGGTTTTPGGTTTTP